MGHKRSVRDISSATCTNLGMENEGNLYVKEVELGEM